MFFKINLFKYIIFDNVSIYLVILKNFIFFEK
jgi:hypothetical protein